MAFKFFQEIQTEKLISHFILKGDLDGKIYIWGEWICSGLIIHVNGVCSALYTVKCTVGGDIWRGYVPHYIPEREYCIILYIYIPENSGQPIFHYIYLIDLIGQK